MSFILQPWQLYVDTTDCPPLVSRQTLGLQDARKAQLSLSEPPRDPPIPDTIHGGLRLCQARSFDETPQSVVLDVRLHGPLQHCVQVAQLRLPVERVVRPFPLLLLKTTFCFALFRLS